MNNNSAAGITSLPNTAASRGASSTARLRLARLASRGRPAMSTPRLRLRPRPIEHTERRHGRPPNGALPRTPPGTSRPRKNDPNGNVGVIGHSFNKKRLCPPRIRGLEGAAPAEGTRGITRPQTTPPRPDSGPPRIPPAPRTPGGNTHEQPARPTTNRQGGGNHPSPRREGFAPLPRLRGDPRPPTPRAPRNNGRNKQANKQHQLRTPTAAQHEQTAHA